LIFSLGQIQGWGFFISLGQQWSDLAKLVGSGLESLNLLGQLRVLRLLAAQNFVNILHKSPCGRL
jgi:hypothetical protein